MSSTEALETLLQGIRGGKGTVNLIEDAINLFDKNITSSEDIWLKARQLQITIVNLDTVSKLVMEHEWFDTGRFWDTPFWPIGPGESQTYHVCSRDGSWFHGISGGISFRVYHVDNVSDEEAPWFVCTYSNPYYGIIKGRCEFNDNKTIVDVWNRMDDSTIIRKPRYGFYRGNIRGNNQTDHADRKLVFIWKSEDLPW